MYPILRRAINGTECSFSMPYASLHAAGEKQFVEYRAGTLLCNILLIISKSRPEMRQKLDGGRLLRVKRTTRSTCMCLTKYMNKRNEKKHPHTLPIWLIMCGTYLGSARLLHLCTLQGWRKKDSIYTSINHPSSTCALVLVIWYNT